MHLEPRWWINKDVLLRPFTIEKMATVTVYIRGGSSIDTNEIAAGSGLLVYELNFFASEMSSFLSAGATILGKWD